MAYFGDSQYIHAKVVDKYNLRNHNVGVIVEDGYGKRYSVEFQSHSAKPTFFNLYGLLDEAFQGKGESLDKLINKGDYIGVVVSRSENPIRSAYRLSYVSVMPRSPTRKVPGASYTQYYH